MKKKNRRSLSKLLKIIDVSVFAIATIGIWTYALFFEPTIFTFSVGLMSFSAFLKTFVQFVVDRDLYKPYQGE